VHRLVGIRNAEVDGRLCDVWWREGVVVAIGEHHAASGIPVTWLDADGGAVVPALHDHHLHLMAIGAARESWNVGPPGVRAVEEFRSVLAEAGRSQTPGEWIRAIGYHESVAGPLDRGRLEALAPDLARIPLRVQHRTGQMWMLNGAACDDVDLRDVEHPGVERDGDGVPTGRVFAGSNGDDPLRDRVPQVERDLVAVARELACLGVTGVTDLTPTVDQGHLDRLVGLATDPRCPIRLTVTGGAAVSTWTSQIVGVGPVKILPAERHVHDVEQILRDIAAARAAGRAVAIHCVTRVGLVVAVAALREAGVSPGDRIEHAAVVPGELVDDLRALGLLVVTQPNFVFERGDEYLTDVEPGDLPSVWRCGSLASAGVPVAGGTDAPFGDIDPWAAMRAAVDRRTSSGALLGPDEAVTPRDALDLFSGTADQPSRPRRVTTGARTDLCVLRVPMVAALGALARDHVRATVGPSGIIEADEGAAPSLRQRMSERRSRDGA
jgi:predicted amidohydrolase YtcJ